MKIKLKVVSMTLKFALLGVVAFAYVACGEGKTKMSKQMDEWYEEGLEEFVKYEYLIKPDNNASSGEIFDYNSAVLSFKIAFYSCVPFDIDKDKIETIDLDSGECEFMALNPGRELYQQCKEQNGQVDESKLSENENFQKCALDGWEKLATAARKLARYKYDSEFDKKSISDDDLAIFVSGLELENAISKMGVLDGEIGKADKEQVKTVAQKISKKAADSALQAYAADTQHKPFSEWSYEYAGKLISAAKKPTESCIEAKCGKAPSDEIGAAVMAAALPYAFVGAFSRGKESAAVKKQAQAAIVAALLNHPYGKCLIQNETQCQLKFIDEYKFEPIKQSK